MVDSEDPGPAEIARLADRYESGEFREPIHGKWGVVKYPDRPAPVRFALCSREDREGMQWAETSDDITCPECLRTLSMVLGESC